MSWILAHLLMLGSGMGIGGLGLLGFLFPAVSVPIVTAIGQWLSRRSLAEIILFAVAAVLIFDHLALLDSHRQVRADQVAIKAAGEKLTAANRNLATSQANEVGLRAAIADQNKAISDLSATSAAQQASAQKASQTAQERVQEAQATAARLRASSRSAGGASAANCDPSDTLKNQWKD